MAIGTRKLVLTSTVTGKEQENMEYEEQMRRKIQEFAKLHQLV